ncbi:hypothetical protein ER13_14895 [Brevundimonas sp. EAKA]|jgi:hypothetical protein|nr:hypothetical protein ER13_14895 [Brevundimonas sp. EAKA]MBA4331420.1 hypothetical protein [Brevundimonas sp.]OGN46195.1 MAG: hypothetical protein A2093_06130 [Caulobacterales bacterium GWE1_67_11]OYX81750.1 MAG: hypothetical protein B7Y85_00460 [Brevundimonas sp. 32-68-21]PZO02669.1 MAG: hypothetical protein DCF29_13175 [Alphaproteobacteria bacterium]
MAAKMSALQYRRLNSDEADQAYVLAHMGNPSLTLESWRAVVDSAPAVGGVIAAVANDCVRAILAYSISTTSSGERQFMVDTLVAFDLLRPEKLIEPLVAAACDLARKGCSSIGLSSRIDAPGYDAVMRQISDAAVLHRVI